MIALPEFRPGSSVHGWRRRLWTEWFGLGVDFKGWQGSRPDPRLYCEYLGTHMEAWLQEAWQTLDYAPRPDREDLLHVLAEVAHMRPTSGVVTKLARRYYDRYGSGDVGAGTLRMRRAKIELAAAGTRERPDPFRSTYERRTAGALTRLGVRWDYEPDVFTWRDHRNMPHRYTPDFRLLDFANTYVEVKGLTGADAEDALKLERVTAWHPYLTLLLWDAAIIDYIEDVTDSAAILALLRATKAA